MSQIRSLLANDQQVDRVIQKVIAYEGQAENLENEIQEYVVTEHIEECFERTLEWIDQVTARPGAETGAWVSGFYGSGKSSFTKYLGYAFDLNKTINGTPFVNYLADRIPSLPVRQRLKTLVNQLQPAVIMLDLASQSYSGIDDVSEVLYRHVLKWAGYSHASLKLAEFELELDEMGKYAELDAFCQQKRGKPWVELQNRTIFAKKVAQEFAQLHNLEVNFDVADSQGGDAALDGRTKAELILKIVRRKSGKEAVFFMIDEVGQYLGSRPRAILDMDGMAKNFRDLGQGKVFIFATAQQTLTEDNKAAAINSTELFKLKDRFPHAVTLESSDIEEISSRRLLGKNTHGESELMTLFGTYRAQLTHGTELQNAKGYEGAPLNSQNFAKLYPFLPAHFKVLLSLLTELSRSTGGTGLRSAIKIIQDIMRNDAGHGKLLDANTGILVTAIQFYDELRLDIERALPSLGETVRKTIDFYGPDKLANPLAVRVAKALCIAQILKNFECSAANLTALLQDTIEASLDKTLVQKTLEMMAREQAVPVGEDGSGAFHFLSSTQSSLEDQRRNYMPFTSDELRYTQDLYREIFQNLKTVTTTQGGLSCQVTFTEAHLSQAIVTGNSPLTLALNLCEDSAFQTTLTDTIKQSLSEPNTLFVLAKRPSDLSADIVDILRSRYMAATYAMDTNAEKKDYALDQNALAERSGQTLRARIEKQLIDTGEIIVGGVRRALYSYTNNKGFIDSIKADLSQLADKVFNKYSLAAIPADASRAHRLLCSADNQIDANVNPSGFLELNNGTWGLSDSPALQEVSSWLQRQSVMVKGSQVYDYFGAAPYGWSRETVLYILAVLFWGGRIEVNISGTIHQTVDSAVKQAFQVPKNLNQVGIQWRSSMISEDDLFDAWQFFTDQGQSGVVYTERSVAETKDKWIEETLEISEQYADSLEKLKLNGAFKQLEELKKTLERLRFTTLNTFIEEIKSPVSNLRELLAYFKEFQQATPKHIFPVVHQTQTLLKAVKPIRGLGKELQQSLDRVQSAWESAVFFKSKIDFEKFNKTAQSWLAQVRQEDIDHLRKDIAALTEELDKVCTDYALTGEEKVTFLARYNEFHITDFDSMSDMALLQTSSDVNRARAALTNDVQAFLDELRPAQIATAHKTLAPKTRIKVPARIKDKNQLSALIRDLQALQVDMPEEIIIELD